MNFTNFLRNNPKILATYVNVVTAVVDKTLIPLNTIMRHVLVVKGLDPNSQPGDNFRKLALESLDRIEDSKEYDDDYDFSWVQKQWKKAAKRLEAFNLTQEKFAELTNLNRWESYEPHEVKITAPAYVENAFCANFNADGTIKPERLTTALRNLKDYAEDLEKKEIAKKVKKTVNKSRSPVSVGKAKTTKKPAVKTQKKFKGVFRRVED